MDKRTGRGQTVSFEDGAEVVGESSLARDIERTVHERTGGQIQKLHVEIGPTGARMHGYCSTFYCKQLAQHAAMQLLGEMRLWNEIEVG